MYSNKSTVNSSIYTNCSKYKVSYQHSIKFCNTASYTPGVTLTVDTWTARDMT